MSDPSVPDRFDGASPLDTLESRLDALGRAVVEEEARRAEPPTAYLETAANRAMFARIRVWTPRLAAAAAVVLAGATVFIFSKSEATRDAGGAGPIATNDHASAVSDPSLPTVGNLQAANRSVASPEQLRLLGNGGSTHPPESTAGPYRASDTRRPDRIDAILGEK